MNILDKRKLLQFLPISIIETKLCPLTNFAHEYIHRGMKHDVYEFDLSIYASG